MLFCTIRYGISRCNSLVDVITEAYDHLMLIEFDSDLSADSQSVAININSNKCRLQENCRRHSVDTPSMVDLQWNMLYWGSWCIFHRVCWGAVGCEWGQPLFTLWLHLCAFSLEYFRPLSQGPSTNINFNVQNSIWRTQTKSSKTSP